MNASPRTATTTLYEELGVPDNAAEGTIRRAYYLLSKIHHPDRQNGTDGTSASTPERFLAIAAAYKVLIDPEQRRRYDAELAGSKRQLFPVQDDIELEDMDLEEDAYYYACRCGEEYVLTQEEARATSCHILTCPQCSLTIRVYTAL